MPRKDKKKRIPRKKAKSRRAGRKSSRKAPRRIKTRRRKAPVTGESGILDTAALERERVGPETGGQSGDVEGLPSITGPGPESIAELVEEGQDFEAEVVSGVENAPDPDAARPESEETRSGERTEEGPPPKRRKKR